MLNTIIRQIKGPDQEAMQKAQEHLNQLTKPPGSLGRLEALTIQLAGITGDFQAAFPDKRVVVMAADHGVVDEGVSAFPKEVTEQMVYNFLRGGAAINVMTRRAGAQVVCVDIGVAADLDAADGLVKRKVAYGTNNMRREAAIPRELVIKAIEVGAQLATELIEDGATILATGEMGIGNTTASSAILAALTGTSVENVVGRGTGIALEAIVHKIHVIEESLQLHQPDPNDVVDVLHKVGGLEICGLAGMILGAAAKSVPVVVDGFISTVAALCAVRMCSEVRSYLVASHQSEEPGHRLVLAEIGLKPLLHCEMRLGEGTGAALVFPTIDTIQAIMREMATFASAGVSGKVEA